MRRAVPGHGLRVSYRKKYKMLLLAKVWSLLKFQRKIPTTKYAVEHV